MSYSEADTRAKLIDPAIHARGWTEVLIRHERIAGAIEITNGKPGKWARGRVDYLLRVKVNAESQPIAVVLIEAKDPRSPRFCQFCAISRHDNLGVTDQQAICDSRPD